MCFPSDMVFWEIILTTSPILSARALFSGEISDEIIGAEAQDRQYDKGLDQRPYHAARRLPVRGV